MPSAGPGSTPLVFRYQELNRRQQREQRKPCSWIRPLSLFPPVRGSTPCYPSLNHAFGRAWFNSTGFQVPGIEQEATEATEETVLLDPSVVSVPSCSRKHSLLPILEPCR